MVSKRKMLQVGIGEVAVPHPFMKDLGDVIGDEAQMIREIGRLHLGTVPARQIAVPAVVKSHIVADGIRQRRKKMRDAGDRFNVAVYVAVEDDPRIRLDRSFVITP